VDQAIGAHIEPVMPPDERETFDGGVLTLPLPEFLSALGSRSRPFRRAIRRTFRRPRVNWRGARGICPVTLLRFSGQFFAVVGVVHAVRSIGSDG
jgi:hypothetical protein